MQNVSAILDALHAPLKDANFRVTEAALICLKNLVEMTHTTFQPYMNMVLGAVVERLGDSKQVVRERALDCLAELAIIQPSTKDLLKVIKDGGEHKNWRVREYVCAKCGIGTSHSLEQSLLTVSALKYAQMSHLIMRLLDTHGPRLIPLQKLSMHAINALEDPNITVRERAMDALQGVYRLSLE